MILLISKQVKRTMKAIRHALTERWYAYEDAKRAAANIPEISAILEVSLEPLVLRLMSSLTLFQGRDENVMETAEVMEEGERAFDRPMPPSRVEPFSVPMDH